MDKKVKITVSLSTNPDVEGRFFVDVRDVTNGRNRQMTTRTRDDGPARRFIEQVQEEGARQGVEVEVVSETRDFTY